MYRYIKVFVFLLITGLPATAQVVPVDSVSEYIGKSIVVFGKIMDGRYLVNSTNKPTLLNMGGKFPNQKLTVVIYGNDRGNFGYKPEEMLLDKVIYVSGKIELYRDQPQIVVSGPFDISFSNPNPGATPTPSTEQTKNKETAKKDKEITNKPIPEPDNKEKIKPVKEKVSKTNPEPEDIKPVVEIPAVAPVKTTSTIPTQVKEGARITLLSNVRLSSGPGNKFTNAGKLKRGTEVVIISISGEWVKIKEAKADEGAFAITGYVTTEDLQ